MAAQFDFLIFAVTHSDDECLSWLKKAQLQTGFPNLSSFLFCCVVNGRFKSLQYLLNQLTQNPFKQISNTCDNGVTKSLILSMSQRKKFIDTGTGQLESAVITQTLRCFDQNPTAASIATHVCQVVKNSAYKMLSHCILDYLLFDCSTYKSSIHLTDVMGAVWLNNDQNDKAALYSMYCMQSYYASQPIVAKTGNNKGYGWYDNHINYDFQMQCNDENTFNGIKQKLENGIKTYKVLLDQYPSMQFVTIFCRQLPHLYGESLFHQTYIKPLIQRESQIKEYDFTNDCQQLFDDLFDIYAGSTHIEDYTYDQNRHNKVINVENVQKFICSCGIRYSIYSSCFVSVNLTNPLKYLSLYLCY